MPTLDWIGKKAVLNHHREVPYHLLKCDNELSVGEAGSGNLLVQGDNLLALKALLPYYAGQVKCIFIDPPYNTGETKWSYNDAVDSPEIRGWLGRTVGAESEDLSRHDKWLCMMLPRLALLRQFLRADGSIFVSIDDTEVGHLRLLCDEIFGPNNFVANVVWQKKYARQNDATWFSTSHDHILVYARDRRIWRPNSLSRSEKLLKGYKNPDSDPRGAWQSVVYTCSKSKDARPNLYYGIPYPKGHAKFGETVWPSPTRVWYTDYEGHLRDVKENRVWWGEKCDKDKPRLKSFLKEAKSGVVPNTIWLREEVGDNQDAKREAMELSADSPFPTPKPTALLSQILAIGADAESLILDSFAGSGTTGHAVLSLNKADGGNRRFILVEMEAEICKATTAARLHRAINGHNGTPPTGGGFRYCTLAPPLFDERGNIRDGVTFADLAAHVYFTETGEPIPKRAGRSPLLGVHNGRAIYLLFNGVLGDKRPDGGNVLTSTVLRALPAHDGPRVVYGEGCRLSAARLRREGVVFKQVPYGIKVT